MLRERAVASCVCIHPVRVTQALECVGGSVVEAFGSALFAVRVRIFSVDD